jgi:hypothetical protein
MPIEVHTEPLKRRYTTSYLSVGCGINLLLVLGALVFPLYIAYMTRLWLVAVVRYEQLTLAYQSSLLVQVQGLKGVYTGYRAPFTATWSTSPAANDLVGSNNLRGMVVRSSFQDTNYDSVGDIFKVTVSVPLNEDETVHSATVVAYFNAALSVRGRGWEGPPAWPSYLCFCCLPPLVNPFTAIPNLPHFALPPSPPLLPRVPPA